MTVREFLVIMSVIWIVTVFVIIIISHIAFGETRNMTVILHEGQYALLCNCGESIKYNYGDVDNNGFRMLSQVFEILVHGPIVEVEEN